MSAQSKFGPGYVYAVSAGTALTAVKLGLTRKADPAEYCRQNYGRVLCPLNILRIVKVPNAGLAELMLFEALNSCRVSVDREVFDLTQDRAKKTALGKTKFLEQLKKHLGEECYRARLGRNRRDVFVGWTYAADADADACE